MLETVMGEGGIKVIPDWCLKGLRKICNEKKILLILDEVQCGVGRSGNFFAFENSKIKPDIVPIAKGIGGGFPLGAILMFLFEANQLFATHLDLSFGASPHPWESSEHESSSELSRLSELLLCAIPVPKLRRHPP